LLFAKAKMKVEISTTSDASLDAFQAGRMQVLANGDIVDCGRLPQTARNNLYKTELCKHFGETGNCRYGPKCQFAHGMDELRGVLRHPKYRTTRCKAFITTGKCAYGPRCRFIHDANAPEEEGMESSNSTMFFTESTDEFDAVKDLMVNPYGNAEDPIDLSTHFGGLKQVTLTPLTSVGSSMGMASPPDFDHYLFRDPFLDFKLENFETGSSSNGTESLSPRSSTGSDSESISSKFSRLTVFQKICLEDK